MSDKKWTAHGHPSRVVRMSAEESTTASPSTPARRHPQNREATVLHLQRSAGNRATTRFVQRAPQADGTITDPVELARSRPIGGSVDAGTRTRLIAALNAVPRSKSVLDAIAKLRGDLDFPLTWSDKGNFHSGGGISLDRNKNEPTWLASMAHEIVHLHAHLAGTAANVRTMGRDQFVNTQMDEEIGAHAAAYVAQLQMGKTSSSSAGFDEFRGILLKDHPDLLKNKDWAAIEALAKPFVTKKYEKEWVGSKTGKNYWDKWRAVWDAAHPDGK